MSMRRRTRWIACGLLSAVVVPLTAAMPAHAADATSARSEVEELVGEAAADSLSAAEVSTVATAADDRDRGAVSVAIETPEGGLEIVRVPVPESAESQVSRILDGAETIAAAAPEVEVRLANDPLRPAQWALDLLDGTGAGTRATGSGVTVAVVDTGVDGTHPDLVDNLVVGASCNTGTCQSPGGTTDVNGHGTHVAGIVAAVAGNGIGTAGLAPGAAIMPVDVFGASPGASGTAVAAGIVWAVDNGADVINLSLGSSSADPVQQAALRHAWRQGVVVFAAAGNTGTTQLQYPASFPEAISVAATTSTDAKASFSTANAPVWIAAPGTGIRSTLTGGGWGDKSGTSMATPYAAAAAALLLEDRPTLTPAQVRHLLRLTAKDLGVAGRDPQTGWGRIRPVQALDLATPPVTGTVAFTLAATLAGNISVAPTVTFTGGMRASRLTISVDGTPVVDEDLDLGESLTRTIDTRTLANGSRSFRVTVTDEAGATWSLVRTATVANAPKIAATLPATATGTVVITPTLTIPIGSTVAKVQLLEGTTVRAQDLAAPWEITWDTAAVGDATRSLALRVVDTAGRVGQITGTVTTWNRPRPAIGTLAATVSGTVAVPVSATPAPGTQLTGAAVQVFTATGTTPIATLAATESGGTWSASWSTGALADGIYRLKAVGTADNGLTGAGAGSGRQVTVSNKPVVAAGASYSGLIVNFAPSATSPVGAAMAKAELLRNGTVIATDTTSPWALSWNGTSAPRGTYTLVVRFTDAAGRKGSSSPITLTKA